MSPTVMRSTPPSVSNSVVVIVIDISARIVHASSTPYLPMPSVMHMPSDETEQYDGPETIVHRGGARRTAQAAAASSTTIISASTTLR